MKFCFFTDMPHGKFLNDRAVSESFVVSRLRRGTPFARLFLALRIRSFRFLICLGLLLCWAELAWSAKITALKAGVAVEDVTPQWRVRKAYANRPPISQVYQRVES
jgi:hypothetical protein